MSTKELLKEHVKVVTVEWNNKKTSGCQVEVYEGTHALGIILHVWALGTLDLGVS